MNRSVPFLLCVAALALGVMVPSAFSQAANTVQKPTLTAGNATLSTSGSLNEKDIADLKTDWTDEKTGIRYSFQAAFGLPKIEDKDKKRFQKMGKVPFRITCSLVESKKTKSGPLNRLMSGTAKFYVQDENKKEVLRKSVALEKMCPS